VLDSLVDGRSAIGWRCANWRGEPSRASILAAAYAFGLIRDHPYVDGNKRVGLIVFAAFLDRTGSTLTANDAEAVSTMLAIAAGEMTEADLAQWVGSHSAAGPGR
jgi:death-on-curing protein